MRNKKLYKNLEEKLEEVSDLPPQDVGPLTSIYKLATSPVKTWPVKILVPAAFLLGIAAQIIVGEKIVKLVSILQHGF